jgi:hypothetical protein
MRTFTLDPGAIDDLGFGETIEACDLAGIDVANMAQASGNAKMKLYLAIAYVVAKRDEPTLAWSEMQRAKLEVGEAPAANPPVPLRRTAARSPASQPPPAGRSLRSG